MKLTQNMRVQREGDVSAAEFSKVLLKIGDGNVPVDRESGEIAIPSGCGIIVNNSEFLKEEVYGNIDIHFNQTTWRSWLCERAILAPKNDLVNHINRTILPKLPGYVEVYKSIDNVVDQDQACLYPTEFLNSLEPSGMPPHELHLKVGAPIMLLRNLDAPRLCNGTRLCVKQMLAHVLEATIMTGQAKGEDVFIP